MLLTPLLNVVCCCCHSCRCCCCCCYGCCSSLQQLSQQVCSQQNTIYQLAANIKVRCISYQLNACLVRGGGAQRSRITALVAVHSGRPLQFYIHTYVRRYILACICMIIGTYLYLYIYIYMYMCRCAPMLDAGCWTS